MTLPRLTLLCAIAAFGVACSTHADTKRTTFLPAVFGPPETAPDFSLPQAPALIRRLILGSKCGGASSDMSRLGMEAGMMTRPETSHGLYLDRGQTPGGTEWFLVRSQNVPGISYCGLAMVSDGQETHVSVANVSWRDMDLVKVAVESGDFLCRCERLSK